MAPTTIVRRAAAATMLGLLLSGSAAAAAIPDPGPSKQVRHPSYHTDCGLERVDAQLVRCDSLTGAGVPAPAWIPERGTR